MTPFDFFGWITVLLALYFGGTYAVKRFGLGKLSMSGSDHDDKAKTVIEALHALKQQYERIENEMRDLEMSKCNVGSLSALQLAVADVEKAASNVRLTFSTALSSNSGFSSLAGFVNPPNKARQENGNGSATPTKVTVESPPAPSQQPMAVVGNYAAKVAKATGERINAREFLNAIPPACDKPNMEITAEAFVAMNEASKQQLVDLTVRYIQELQRVANSK